MKILIVSDTHRHDENLLAVIKKEKPFDFLIHLGDIEGSEYVIKDWVECPVEIVAGNNDFFSGLEKEKIIHIGKYSILMTHGHYYYVNMGTKFIVDEARGRGVDIVMFGHTHKPLVDRECDVIALNPGSLSYPRQEGRRPSYIVMTIDDFGQLDFLIQYL